MSEEHIGFNADRPTGVGGGVQSVPVSTAAEAAQQAGRVRTGVDTSDPVTQLELQCKAFIEEQPIKAHNRMMALSKVGELFFWIRSGIGRE